MSLLLIPSYPMPTQDSFDAETREGEKLWTQEKLRIGKKRLQLSPAEVRIPETWNDLRSYEPLFVPG